MRHQEQLFLLNEDSTLHFSCHAVANQRACLLLHVVCHCDTHGAFESSQRQAQFVKHLDKMVLLSAVPAGQLRVCSLCHHVFSMNRTDGQEVQIMGLKPDAGQEGKHLIVDLIVPLLTVVSFLHLVEDHDELGNSETSCEHSVLFRSALSAFPTTLELRLGHIEHENATISLRCSSDHVCDEVTVTWGVQNRKIAIWCLEMSCGDFNGDTTLLLLLCVVHDVGELEASLVVDLCLTLVRP